VKTVGDKVVRHSFIYSICFILPNSRDLQAYYVTVVEDRPIPSAEYHLPLLAKTDPTCSAVSLR